MEALDNPSYFRLSQEEEMLQGGPRRGRDVAPELWRTRRASETLVFSGTDVAYYNISKRHSLATLPRMAKPKQVLIGRGSSTMLDITLVSSSDSEDATLWANYLTSCFNEISREEKRSPFKLARVMAEDVLLGLPVEGSTGSRLQIVIVCPKFLRVLASNHGLPILASMLQPATVLAMLLGVTPQTLDNHQLAGLFRFEQWRKMTVKDKDKTFVGDFLGVAMDVLSRSWQLQQAMQQVRTDSNKAHFSLIPKKIKVGQNKLLILLNDPLCNSDKINITVEKSGQKLEVSSVKRRNPYTLQFTMPNVCMQTSQLVSVAVERNGRPIGHRLVKCESRLRELDQLLRSTDNPLAFMCQALGINGGEREQLDSFLVENLQKNIPPNFNLLNVTMTRSCTSREEYPTLLHFAARFGLEKLCWQLLECPGGEAACQLKNCQQLGPAEMADRAGHNTLAQALHGYLQMTELSSMYAYLKKATEKNEKIERPQDFGEGNYLLPRRLSDTYLVPPKARPVTPPLLGRTPPPSPLRLDPLENYQSPPPHARPFTPLTPSTPSTPTDHFSAYLQMHSPVSDTSGSNCSHFDNILSPEKKYISHPSNDDISISSSGPHYTNTRCSGSSVCGSSTGSSKMNPDEELAEIINDFKNNVFTISEVEKLVEAWKNRNDVQQSFREKQEQLNEMRMEYERIQQKMKEQMKRPTPFDRIKKFFTRKPKNDGKDKADVCRPVSSLSLHSSCSSSSSGRMSTGSGASLGDSGTHSDPDESKSPHILVEKNTPSETVSDKLERVNEIEVCPSDDEYINGNPSLPCSRQGIQDGDLLPQPPTIRRTIVEVHRSDVLSDSEDTAEEVQKWNNTEKQSHSNEYVIIKSHQNVNINTEESNNNEPSIKSDYIDVLSPPESAFLNDDSGNTIIECCEDMDESMEADNIKEEEDNLKENRNIKDSEETSVNVESTVASSCILYTADTKDSVDVLNNNEDTMDNVFTSGLHEYVNVSSYLPPPIPPRFKFKNVLL